MRMYIWNIKKKNNIWTITTLIKLFSYDEYIMSNVYFLVKDHHNRQHVSNKCIL